MANTKKSAEATREVTRSVTVPLPDTTIDDILAGQADVGAPNTARIAVGSAPYNPNNDGTPNPYPHQATYTWTEDL